MDPLVASLSLGALGSGMLAVRLWWPERGGSMPESESPEPLLLTKFRGWEALRMNVFPRSWDSACSSCNGRALVWTKDDRRHDAWIGTCRRCGIARVDVVAGVALER